MESQTIEVDTCTATSCPCYLPFTALPSSWAGKRVLITLIDAPATGEPVSELFGE